MPAIKDPKKSIKLVGEHHIPIPQPKSKSEIYLIDEKPEDAYWRRIQFPQIWYDFNARTKVWQSATIYDSNGVLISLSEDDSKLLRRLLLEDLYRRKYGMHMKNKDEIIWVAPDYYFTLQWAEMKDLPDKFGRFRAVQNDAMIAWHYTKYIEWAVGLILPKCKKSGITQIISSAFLNESTMLTNMEFGMASKEFDHVKNVAMAYYFHSYDHLPYIIQPSVAKRNLSEIVFKSPTARVGTKSGKDTTEWRLELNNRVNAYKTKTTAFDGPVLKRGFIDESPKWWEASSISVDAALTKNRETVKLQSKKNGSLIIASYMPEIDDQGYRDYKKWCEQSKLFTKNERTGTTLSQMIVLPITAVMSHELCFDKWGNSDEAKALEILMNERNAMPTLSEKQAHKRQYPTDWNDMMDAGGKGSVFDNNRLGKRVRTLTENLAAGKLPFKYSHLEWSNKDWESGIREKRRPKGKFASVIKRNLTDEEIMEAKHELAPFITFHELPMDMVNRAIRQNNLHEDDNCYCPLSDETFCGAFDPTDYVLKKDVLDGSMNAATGGFIFDPTMNARFGKVITNVKIFDYFFREEDPDDDLENLIKAIIFWGGYWIIEANKKWVITALKKEGLHHFLLLKDENGIIRPYQHGDENTLVNTTANMIDAYTRALKRYIAAPKSEADTDYLEHYHDIKDLDQYMNFETTDTKRYDKVVCDGYWRLAIEALEIWLSDHADGDRTSGYDQVTLQYVRDNLLN